MFKVTNACKYHGNARFVGSLDGFFVSNRATWLNNGCNTMLCRRFYSIPNGKNASDANTAPFAASPACSRAIFAEPTRFICPAPTPSVRFHWNQNRIGFYVFYELPSKFEGFPLFLCWLYLCNHFIVSTVFLDIILCLN